jgi:hypothetical protein
VSARPSVYLHGTQLPPAGSLSNSALVILNLQTHSKLVESGTTITLHKDHKHCSRYLAIYNINTRDPLLKMTRKRKLAVVGFEYVFCCYSAWHRVRVERRKITWVTRPFDGTRDVGLQESCVILSTPCCVHPQESVRFLRRHFDSTYKVHARHWIIVFNRNALPYPHILSNSSSIKSACQLPFYQSSILTCHQGQVQSVTASTDSVL